MIGTGRSTPAATGPQGPSRHFVVPGVRVMREQPVRRLSREECDRLEYAGPLVLARREYRFLVRWWRPTGEYVVMRGPEVVMTCTAAELASRGISPGG